uniref:GNAT family N-acetyltransferase n=1 Tax=unclassified Variovorax TaxID=663243 RepID=UPI000D3B84BE
MNDTTSTPRTPHVRPPELVLTDAPADAARAAIVRGLLDHNLRQTGISDHRPLAVLIHAEDGGVAGGLWGRTAYGWLFTELLYVPDALRGQGLGRSLLLRAEAEAQARGCHGAWLDTFSFQARPFYESLGYECFGEIADYPRGASRFFMKKALPAA